MFRQIISTPNSKIRLIEIKYGEFSKDLSYMTISFKNPADVANNKALVDRLKETTGLGISFYVSTPEEVQERLKRIGIMKPDLPAHSTVLYRGTIEDLRKIVQELMRLREISDTDEYPALIRKLNELDKLITPSKISDSITNHQYEIIVNLLECYVPDVVKLLPSYEKIISLFSLMASQNMDQDIKLFCVENSITFPNEYFKNERELAESIDAIKKIIKGDGLKTTFDRVAAEVPSSRTLRHAAAYYVKTFSQKYFYPDELQPINLNLQKMMDSELIFYIEFGRSRQQYNRHIENPYIKNNLMMLDSVKKIADHAEKAIREEYNDVLSDPVTFTRITVTDKEKPVTDEEKKDLKKK